MTESIHKRAFRSNFFKSIELIVLTTVSIVLTPFIISKIGIESYGLWLLATSIGNWGMLINRGLTAAIQREYGDAVSNNNHSQITFIYSNAIVMLFFMGLLPLTTISSLALFPEWFNIGQSYFYVFSIILILLAFQLFIRFMMNCVYGLFSNNIRYDIISKVDILFAFIRCGLFYFILNEGYGLLGLSAAHVINEVLSDLVKVIIVKRMYPYLKFNRKLFSFSFFKKLFKFGNQLLKNTLAQTLTNQMMNLIISKANYFNELGSFGLYRNLSNYFSSIVEVPTQVYAAMITKAFFRSHNRLLRKMIDEATLIFCYTSFLLCSFLVVGCEQIIWVWIKKPITSYSLSVFFITVAMLYELAARPLLLSLVASGNLKSLPNISLLFAVIGLIGSYYLIIYYGVAYAPLAPLIIQTIKTILILPILSEKKLKTPWFSYYFRLFRLTFYFTIQALYVPEYLKAYEIINLYQLFAFAVIYCSMLVVFILIDISLFDRKIFRHMLIKKQITIKVKKLFA